MPGTRKSEKIFADLKSRFNSRLTADIIKDKSELSEHDVLKAISLAVRDVISGNWIGTQKKYDSVNARRVCYLSMEYLLGSMLGISLINLGLYEKCSGFLGEMGYDLDKLIELEPDMGLGNGGLGRLAACFQESLATLELPACGYGLRYEYGIFSQEFESGYQVEKPDNWLRWGNPWEVERADCMYRIRFNGKVIGSHDNTDNPKSEWSGTDDVYAAAYDTPVPGYRNGTVNTLRLWRARAKNEFDLADFNKGNYTMAVEEKNLSEAITSVLYPSDETSSGKILRLKQQYFFVSATLQDIISNFRKKHNDFSQFPQHVTVHLNDTHPAIAIAELMRILIDEEHLIWEQAWQVTTETFAYTNHTLLPEALEQWHESIIQQLLPRHHMIIKEINARFLTGIKNELSEDTINSLSVIGKDGLIRMANLAIVGSYSVNGVAELHSEILKKYTFSAFDKIYPGKFNNKTNGVNPRRFIIHANPQLSALITSRIGNKWVTESEKLIKLEAFISDEDFRRSWENIKNQNKRKLANYIKQNYDVSIDPDSIFDSQIKRFHEYKRQLLNALRIISLYFRLKDSPTGSFIPRTMIFAGNAASSYFMAKLIIKLINSIAHVINNDKDVSNRLKIIFLRNYCVSLAQRIIPATELSEQISTAGFEASGTGNMKLALNGALTIGTLDGANIEIRNRVGEENIYIFGLNAEEIMNMRVAGYEPRKFYESNSELKRVIDALSSNYFNKSEPGIFQPIVEELLGRDYFFVMADYASYINMQDRAANDYLNRHNWITRSILNSARSGWFSSDRTIREYAGEIWKIKPVSND